MTTGPNGSGAPLTEVDEIGRSLHAFLAAQAAQAAHFVPDAAPDGADGPPERVEGVARVASGRSRENWLFDAVWPDGRREPLIARRDPLGGLLETDRRTEHAVLEALVGSPVPAPLPRGLDPDGAALGRPTLLMRRAPGDCDYFVLNGDRPLPERVDLARRFCALLASVHAVDWRAVGLDGCLEVPVGPPSQNELERWEAIRRRDQLEAWPELDLAVAWLRARAPHAPAVVLVHGDFKPGNVLLVGDRITALLDWELAHLGDPMEDLGWVTQPLRTREHLIPGAWERADLLAHYASTTGIPVDEAAVTWWNAFACYKTAVMQISGLRAYLEGRCEEAYRPTNAVLAALAELTGG